MRAVSFLRFLANKGEYWYVAVGRQYSCSGSGDSVTERDNDFTWRNAKRMEA